MMKNCPVCGNNNWKNSEPYICDCGNCGTRIPYIHINDRVMQWNDVADKLPKDERIYKVRYKNGEFSDAYYSREHKTWVYVCDDGWESKLNHETVKFWEEDHTWDNEEEVE